MLKSSFGRNERKGFEDAQNKYKRVCRDQRDLAAAEDRLGELRADAEAAKADARMIPKINDALKLQRVRRGVSLRQEEIDLFPAEIARVSEQDAALLDEFIKK